MSKDEKLLDAEEAAACKIDKMTDLECRADLESRLIQELKAAYNIYYGLYFL